MLHGGYDGVDCVGVQEEIALSVGSKSGLPVLQKFFCHCFGV